MDTSAHIDTALRGFVDRIVSEHERRDEVNGDIRVVYAEAKDAGFNVTILRGMVKEARMEGDARNSLYELQREYRIKLGMLADTPLGRAAEERAAMERPAPFAEQPVHQPRRRGRPPRADTRPMFDA